MLKQLKRSEGFTLIELLVVIVVIGILVALTLPNLFAAQERARDTERKNDLRNVKQQLESYYNDNNTYPVALADLSPTYMDAVPQDPQGGDYDYTVLDENGDPCTAEPCATYTLGADLENENDADHPTYTEESVNQ